MNDYERYDFWHRETVQVKIKDDKRTMSKLIESNKKFDEKKEKSETYITTDIKYPDIYYNIINI